MHYNILVNTINYSLDFKKNKFVKVNNVLSDREISIFTQYALLKEQEKFYTDYQSFGAFSRYGDALMESLLVNLQKNIEECTDMKLYPTFSYYRVYRNGHELLIHKDRSACEISVSLALGYSYDYNNYKWPLIIDNISIEMNPGDMVIYRGLDLEHFRNPLLLEEDAYHCQVFLCYVDANGKFQDERYDKKEGIDDPIRFHRHQAEIDL